MRDDGNVAQIISRFLRGTSGGFRFGDCRFDRQGSLRRLNRRRRRRRALRSERLLGKRRGGHHRSRGECVLRCAHDEFIAVINGLTFLKTKQLQCVQV